MAGQITRASIKVDGDDFYESLVKLTQQPIVDVWGYVTNNGWGPVFKLCRILLADGTVLETEGEHDFPYVTGLDPDTLERLADEG